MSKKPAPEKDDGEELPQPARRSTLILPDEVVRRSEAIQAGSTPADQNESEERKEPEAASCGSCVFFVVKAQAKARDGGRDVNIGECRARAPTPVFVGMEQNRITQAAQPVVNGFFALTNEEVWCGDWKPSHPVDKSGMN